MESIFLINCFKRKEKKVLKLNFSIELLKKAFEFGEKRSDATTLPAINKSLDTHNIKDILSEYDYDYINSVSLEEAIDLMQFG